MHRTTLKYGLVINIDKTKIMATQDITANIHYVGTLQSSKWTPSLTVCGSFFTQDAHCIKDVTAKLGKGSHER